MSWLNRASALCVVLSFLTLEPAAAEPRRVLLLHSFGFHFAPWSAVAGRFREELARQSPFAIDLYEGSLESARLSRPHDQSPFINYLTTLFAEQKLDLVVALGAPAARFFQRYRRQLFPSTPLLIAAADQRTLDGAALGPNDATATVNLDLPRLVEHILRVLPQTTNVAVAIGDSPLERYWEQELRRAFAPFKDQVTFEWLSKLPLGDMLRRTSMLPPRSAILYATVRVDAASVPYDQDRVLARLRETANAPIFSYMDDSLGLGIVGGPLLSSQELGHQTAAAAVRILNGEAPGDIRMPALGFGTPSYDWRELQRWSISEDRLPAGSLVKFREPTAWERYRWPLLGVLFAMVIQAALIAWLLIERHGRLVAQLLSRRRSLEVLHLSRTAEVGAMSASFAHELYQPLAAIRLSTDAAENLLQAEPPQMGKLKDIIADIRQADEHAVESIRHLRKLLQRNREVGHQVVDLNEAISDALLILSPEARKRRVAFSVDGVERSLPVRGDRVHLQQVILNLVANGMDAMADTAVDARRMSIHTSLPDDTKVEVLVSDGGTGIPNDKLNEIFDTFYTTKAEGTGLGLAITRTIIETYGGRVWAENRPEGGAVFRFTLPLAQTPCHGADRGAPLAAE